MANMEKNLAFLQEHLNSSEQVIAAVYGAYETKILGQDSLRTGVFVATNERVVFYAKKMGGYDFQSFPYESISSIDASKGMMGHKFTILTAGTRVEVKNINKGDVPEFVKTVQGRMGKSGAPVGVADELAKLAALKDSGMLSEAEWDRATTLYLGKPLTAREEAISQLRSLHSLHVQGVLSESEFNSKKWDVLARDR
jgi:hypothetical protein